MTGFVRTKSSFAQKFSDQAVFDRRKLVRTKSRKEPIEMKQERGREAEEIERRTRLFQLSAEPPDKPN